MSDFNANYGEMLFFATIIYHKNLIIARYWHTAIRSAVGG